MIALLGAVRVFAAATFTALPYTDPFAPATQVGTATQPAGSVFLNENLNGVSLPVTRSLPAGLNTGLDAITVEWWMKQKAQTGNRILDNPNGTIVHGPGFVVKVDWQWGDVPGSVVANFSQCKAGAYSGNRGIVIPLEPSDQQWHHYVITYDRRTVRSYRDGELIGQLWLDNNTDRIGPFEDDSGAMRTSVLEIGRDSTMGGYPFEKGFLESVRVSSVALTPYQVKKNFENWRQYSKTLYAAPGANGTGSQASPASLTSALSQAGGSTRIILQPGTYNGSEFQLTRSGTGPREHILIVGANGSSPAIISGGSPTLSGAGHVTLRNITFSSDAGHALTINNAPRPVEVDACRFSGSQRGLSVVNSPRVIVQNCAFQASTGIYFSGAPESVVRNNTIVGGAVGVQYDSGSGSISFLNNLMSGQSSVCLVVNNNSQKWYRGDGNLYNPASGTAATINGTSYSPSQVQNKSLAQGWYNLDTQDKADNRQRRTAHAAEARSTIVAPAFVGRNAGDLRLAFVDGNAIDTGAERTPQRAIIPPVTDAQGSMRHLGNAVDVGAFETQPPSHAVFVLDRDYTTSAGVYKNDGTLVRTLFSGQRRAQGTNVVFWNGLRDDNTVAPTDTYTIKLIAHNVNYVWEGVVGNSSNPNSGSSVHGGFEPIYGMTIVGNTAFYTSGYNENKYELYRFDTSNPNKVTKSFGPRHDIYSDAVMDLATDGNRLYGVNNSQVHVYSVSTCQPTSLGNGQNKLNVGNGRGWIEVQRTGNLLFVSRRNQNTIYILDKNSGNQTGSISVNQPKDLAVTPSGDLWVISGNQAVRYTVSSGGGTAVQTITGFNNPVAIACSPVDGSVLVVDAGTQQIKAFAANGSALWTHGQLNGYANGPRVTHDKFYFLHVDQGRFTPGSFLAFQPDGTFWVGDTFLSRYLHFSMSRQVLHEIDYQPHTYTASVDLNNPRRVFNRFTEYHVDYSKPLGQGWVITNFFGYNLPTHYYGFEDGPFSVVTLSNGRTYGTVYDGNPGSTKQIVEITANGFRETGIRNLFVYTRIEKDGSILRQNVSGGNVSFTRQELTGFDANGNPRYATAQTIATAPVGNGAFTSDPVAGRNPQLCGDKVISFDNERARTGFHLGAVKQGSNKWLWKASPSAGGLDGLGRFDSWVEYGGNLHYTAGRNILYGYHGEFYLDQGQANQFMHFFDNGLFVGQFANPMLYGVIINGPGAAGNAFAPTVVEVGSDVYLYHNDEWSRGSHRWKVDGIGNIRELTAAISVGPAPAGTTNTPSSGGTNDPAGTLPAVSVVRTGPAAAEGGANGVFTISRTGPTTNALPVNISFGGGAVNGVDYQLVASSVIIPVGASNTTVTIRPIDDTVVEGTELVVLNIDSSFAYLVGTPSSAGMTIADNDSTPPPVDLPDLVVLGVSATPANPAPGDNVRFSATIKNQGTQPTPAGTIVGLGFYVNGGAVTSWAVQPQLQPGQSVTITATDGVSGADWTAVTGSNTVVAFVDDVNRISESVENNNTMAMSLVVGSTPPTVPVAKIRPRPGGKMEVSWTSVANKVYRVCYKDRLTDATWTPISPEITATGTTTAYSATPPTNSSMRLYNIIVVR